ncbi:MAG: hypothetical protein CUN57_01420 [Phototrophicales bacterium]|nr:MAG: hypothetical protein CUN57_01420 [Phototrophicales bacterium]
MSRQFIMNRKPGLCRFKGEFFALQFGKIVGLQRDQAALVGHIEDILEPGVFSLPGKDNGVIS